MTASGPPTAGATLRYPTLALAAVATAFYLYTLAPSLVWADGARLQMDASLGGSTYWFLDQTGEVPTDGAPFDHLGVAAWDHPVYVLLGRLFLLLPWGEPLARINLLSALAAALTVTLVFRVGVELTGDRRAAALGAAALMVSHTFWFHAVTAEVYTLHCAFMTALVGLALRRWREPGDLALFGLLAGLGLANHVMLGLTLLPLLGWLCWRPPVLGRRRLLAAAGLFVAGLAPLWIQLLRMARVADWGPTLAVAAGQPALAQRLGDGWGGAPLRNFGEYAGWLLFQFTPVGVGAGLLGFAVLARRRPAVAVLLGSLFALHVAFSAQYTVPDRFAFHLPSYLIFALAMSIGAARMLEGCDRWVAERRRWLPATAAVVALAALLSPVALYASAPGVLRGLGWSDARVGIPPIGIGARDGLRYFLNPNRRGDRAAETFGRSTLAQLAPGALVLTPKSSDQETFLVLRYFQLVERLRPDVELDLLLAAPARHTADAVWARVRAQAPCRPIYLASLDPAAYPVAQLRRDYGIVEEANLYRLARNGTAPLGDCGAPPPALPLRQLIETAMSAR